MALHIVRSLGQAFDVCHRLNPRPKKAKKEDGEESGEKDNGEEGEVKNGEGEEQKETDEANISVELGTELGRDAKPQQQKDVHKDLGAPVQAATLPNGAPQMAFESNFTTGEGGGGRGGGPGGALPPFLVSKNSTSGLPDLPEGSGGLPPAGRPRPRPSTTHQQQVYTHVVHALGQEK